MRKLQLTCQQNSKCWEIKVDDGQILVMFVGEHPPMAYCKSRQVWRRWKSLHN